MSRITGSTILNLEKGRLNCLKPNLISAGNTPGKILMKNSNNSTVIKEPPSIISARCDEEYLTTKTFSLSWCK